MQPQMHGCCEMTPSWIFVYENSTIFAICETHFESDAHRCFVTDVIDYDTGKRYLPAILFDGDEPPLVESL